MSIGLPFITGFQLGIRAASSPNWGVTRSLKKGDRFLFSRLFP